MLTFARELKKVLVRDGPFRVVLTRDDDVSCRWRPAPRSHAMPGRMCSRRCADALAEVARARRSIRWPMRRRTKRQPRLPNGMTAAFFAGVDLSPSLDVVARPDGPGHRHHAAQAAGRSAGCGDQGG